MLKLIKKLANEDDGLEMVEWAIVAAVVTSVGIGTLNIIGATLNLAFITLQARVQAG
jgi:Flp pilus assembly pilin Flp